MKAKGRELGDGITDKKYYNEYIYELIYITNYFPELRNKKKR